MTTQKTRLRRVAATIARLRSERAVLVRQLRAEGATLREIAAVAQCSPQTVLNILGKEDARL